MKGLIEKGITTVVIIVLLTSLLIPFLSMQKDYGIRRIVHLKEKVYKPHSTIKINDDSDFTYENGVIAGSGTKDDPYIIAGWDIDAHGKGNAIYIGNTKKYFIVRNCYLHNASYHSWPYSIGAGITLYRVRNGTIRDNLIDDNRRGIYFDSSDSNTIEGNIIDNNSNYGIYIEYSSKNIISNNTLKNNDIGIYVEGTYNEIQGNDMWNNGIFLYNNYHTLTTQNISTTNTVNGKTVYYYKNANMNNVSVPADAGQVLLGNVSHLILKNLKIENASVGIEIGYSKHIVIRNCDIRNNSISGIHLYYSFKNKIDENNIENNGLFGIFLHSSFNNIIEKNKISNHDDVGIYMYNSHNNTIAKNNVNNNVREGIYFEFSNNNTIDNNIIHSNGQDGIRICCSDGNIITNNTLKKNSKSGLQIGISNNTVVINNMVVDNHRDGICLIYGSSKNKITKNKIINNSGYGLMVSMCNHNLIFNNYFYYNRGSGDRYRKSHIQAYDKGKNNLWNNSTLGNYWHDWANNNDTNDKNHDGLVDWPYVIRNGIKDNYPLKNATFLMVPLAPESLNASIGDCYVNLTWNKPQGNGSTPIIKYVVYRNGKPIATVPAYQLWYNDTNITNGIEYRYYVTAVNTIGESEGSEELKIIPHCTGKIKHSVPKLHLIMLVLAAILLITFLLFMFRNKSRSKTQ